MAGRRRYEDSCGMAQALNVVGERWALLVVRELLLGPKRFSDLRADLPGISPNVLSQRLSELEGAGVLGRRKLPPPAGAWVYELTPWGAELETVVIQLGRWGARSPSFDRERGLSVSSVVLSMRTMFRAEAARGVDLDVELRLGEHHFHAAVRDGAFTIDRGAAGDADVVVSTDPITLATVVYDGRSLAEALAEEDLILEGDRAAFEQYLSLFWLPEPAGSPAV